MRLHARRWWSNLLKALYAERTGTVEDTGVAIGAPEMRATTGRLVRAIYLSTAASVRLADFAHTLRTFLGWLAYRLSFHTSALTSSNQH